MSGAAAQPRLRAVNIDCNWTYEYERSRFGPAGVDLILAKARGEDEVIRVCAGADIVLLENADQPFNARIIATLERCRAIVRYGVGVDNIDVAAASKAGIIVANAADFCTEEVSDHAVALTLAHARRVLAMDRHIRAGGWADFPRAGMRRISHLTLGLVGYGRIARAVARKMAGFQMKILAADPFVTQAEPGSPVEIVPLERLFAEADLVSVHTPLLPDTRGLVGERLLRLMKPTAGLINTSRGPVVDEPALIRALQEKWIAGAALDVTVEEPLAASSPLRQLPGVILTPHHGAFSEDAMDHLRRTVGDTVEALGRGFWPPYPVNPKVQPRVPLQARPV
jgi:D-3-phosphoglycerate dehydrogenase